MLIKSFCYVYFGLLFAAISSGQVSVQGKFSVNATSYDCSNVTGNLICLGSAHKYGGDPDGRFAGRLSLIHETDDGALDTAGIAFYKNPVRMRDPSTGLLASFNTSFSFSEVPKKTIDLNEGTIKEYPGDGITFVISANATLGEAGWSLGIFDGFGSNSFKSIVVEFDNYFNPYSPVHDIGWNHVSLDFMNISPVIAKSALDVHVLFASDPVVYAWVEYNANTRCLQVRISNTKTRPSDPFLNWVGDLSDNVEEIMYVGFSGSNGSPWRSYYYIGDWTFDSTFEVDAGRPGSSPNTPSIPITVGIRVLLGVPVLLVIIGIVIFSGRMRDPGSSLRRWGPLRRGNSTLQLAEMSQGYRFSYKELSVATGGFSPESLLGEGGFGSVHRGILATSGVLVAVKKIKSDSNQGEKEFMAEVSIISQLRHRNLIQLLGWCKERGKYLIVYDLMCNGSLDKVLFRPNKNQSELSWPQRFNIVTGTAAAVDYLHQGSKQQVIHRDIKASNIMLDDEWNAKLGDFGLARLVDHQRIAVTTGVAGTFGYIAPEAAASGRFTDKTDVFSFGAVALEIACGRSSVARHLDEDEIVLVDWVWKRLSEGDLLSVVDRRLGEYDVHWMEVVLLMGLLCSHPNPVARPAMRQVVQVLAGDVPVPPVPTSKPGPVFGRDSLGNVIDSHHSSNPRTNSWTNSRFFSRWSSFSGENSSHGLSRGLPRERYLRLV